MNALDLFLREHAALHSAAVAEAEVHIDWLVGDLTAEEWRARPDGLNSLAWIFWHLARVEDACVSILVASRPQLLDGDRKALLEVDRRDQGEGMSKIEVAEVSDAVDLGALSAYRDEVGRRTREHAHALWPGRWDEGITQDDVARAIAAGVATDEYSYVIDKPREMLLFWWGLHHSIYHLGQASMIKSALRAG